MYEDPTRLSELLKKFGLHPSEYARIVNQTDEIMDTMSRLSFPNERAERDFRNRLLDAYQNRPKNEALLAQRLAEIDTTQHARHSRAALYVTRIHELKPASFWAPVSTLLHLYRPYGYYPTFMGKRLDSYEITARVRMGFLPFPDNALIAST